MSITYLGELVCLRCAARYGEAAAFGGCPACAEQGVPVALRPDYAITRDGASWRWRDALPLAPERPLVSLGEGGTPLLPLRRLGSELGIGELYLKDESRNPTWSWKDRLASVAVSKAAADGADTVIVSTSGNHGAAVAAYAAAAGLRCVVLTMRSAPVAMRTLMQVYGAAVFAYEDGPSRWAVMREAVRAHGWAPMSNFADPPLGSNPFGVDGYKTIAFEIVRDLGRVPDDVVVPASYADGLAGIYRGFADLVALGLAERVPRLIAGEVFGPYTRALAAGDEVAGPVPARDTRAFSIASPVGTYQGLDALRRSGGRAVVAGDDRALLAMQQQVAAMEGLYLEVTGVVPLVAARTLAGGGALRERTVVAVGTSTGLKDVAATAELLRDPPVLPPTLAALDRALEDRT
ncbi:pyridoxal-phosphate dependent enzyme [Nonomuraea sp. N2-4H]|uniref:threonine synthase n=1 Tax=unclassified Nonomuraea TaxID=2593643 RepID=UPI003248E146